MVDQAQMGNMLQTAIHPLFTAQAKFYTQNKASQMPSLYLCLLACVKLYDVLSKLPVIVYTSLSDSLTPVYRVMPTCHHYLLAISMLIRSHCSVWWKACAFMQVY
jgi:hypothetical protein